METPSNRIGYARVSTDEQNLDLQVDALTKAGCGQVYREQGVSGMARQRPQLEKALAALQPGDVLVVWKLDRLGRSLGHLIDLIRQLGDRGCGFQSLSEGMDTSTSAGRLLFHVVGSLAEFERSLIVERTKAGLVAARNRGVTLGRRFVLTPDQVRMARTMVDAGESTAVIAKSFKVGRATLYRALTTAAE